MAECNHEFEYKVETVILHSIIGKCWFDGKRVIIFCKKCGMVTHDNINSEDAYGQDRTKS